MTVSGADSELVEDFNAAYAELTAAGAPFAWTERELRGTPVRVFDNALADMRTVWETSAQYGDSEYLVYGDERYSYTQAHARVRALADYLRTECGAGPGTRVAISMRNYPEWVLAHWAIICTGAAVVGMNSWWTAPEMEFAIDDAEPVALITDGERLERLGAAGETGGRNLGSGAGPGGKPQRAGGATTTGAADTTGTTGTAGTTDTASTTSTTGTTDTAGTTGTASTTSTTGTASTTSTTGTTGRAMRVIATRVEGELPAGVQHWNSVSDPANAPDTLPDADIDPGDDALIFYTSGTTGFPKGARLTHRAVVHNLLNIIFVNACGDAARARRLAAGSQGQATGQGGTGHRTPEPAPVAVALLPVPLFHVTGCNCVMHPVTIGGGRLVLMYRWDTTEALRLIERERVTVLTGVPTMSRELLQHPGWSSTDTSSLRSMGGGGAAVPADLVRRIDEGLEHGRPGVGYGLTEVAGVATAINNEFYLARPSSVGPPVPCMEAKVIDGDGSTLGAGQRGELLLRGPNLMEGYLNQPDATAEAVVDGWFRTGDVAEIDGDGWIHIRDRIKDVVIRGGENVHCSEVEAAIYELDQVAEAAVFGLPDERLGEEVAAAIVIVPGTRLDHADVSEHLEGRLARFKHPSRVWFLGEPLPRNANGKFLKRELQERFAS